MNLVVPLCSNNFSLPMVYDGIRRKKESVILIVQIKNFIQIKTFIVGNTISLKSDILFACISHLISFILIYKNGNSDNPFAIKTLIS